MKAPETAPLNGPAAGLMLVSWAAFGLLHADPVSRALLLLAGVCALLRGRLDIPRSLWLAWSLLGLVAAAYLFSGDSKIATQSGLLFHQLYLVAVALGWASLPALVRRHTRREMWMSLALAGCFFLLCGLNLQPLTAHFAALSALWAGLLGLSALRFSTGRSPGLAAWLTLLPGAALLGTIAFAYSFSERQANFLMRLFASGRDISLAFPAQNRLNTLLWTETSPAVITRCFSERPERYLPGRVYVRYQDGAWSEAGPSVPRRGRTVAAGYRYPVSSGGQTTRTDFFEVNSSPMVLLAPRDALSLEIDVPDLSLLSGHLLELRGGGNDFHRYRVERSEGSNLAPAESPEYLRECRRAPRLDPGVLALARQHCAGATTSLDKARALESWLQSDFRYGFGYDYAGAADPVADFLLKKPPAHCEIFASSMVLMLRSQGVPCRYLNGFVCVERSWSENYWVVRVRDAHAWVEVWHDGAWHTFDPTPPAAIAPPQSWRSWFDSLREALFYRLSGLWRADPTRVFHWLWAHKRWLALALAGLWLWRWRGWRWSSRRPNPPAVPEHLWIARLSQALSRHGLERRSWETLEGWGERAREGPAGTELAEWLKDYAAYRYGGAPEAELGPRWQELLGKLKTD